MAGGSGTRFWPESRTHRPKQLLPITGGLPMLTETVNRMDPLVPVERIWVVTNAQQVDGVLKACPELKRENVLVEPCARNTAPAVGLAASVIHHQDPEAVMAVLPADHAIRPVEEFQRSLKAGAEAASQAGTYVTFGIPPTYAATGYGYIRRAGEAGEYQGLSCYAVDSFTEKPDAAKAQRFLDEGIYFWNSGIFVWRADTVLNGIAKHMPALAAGLSRIRETWNGPQFQATLEEFYPTFESVPVDIGIMEKVEGVLVLSTPYRWSDVGSWKALYGEVAQDAEGNAQVFPNGGTLLTENAKGILAYSRQNHIIAVLGLDDVVVVHTEDALLVAHREQSEDVKKFVQRLKDSDQEHAT